MTRPRRFLALLVLAATIALGGCAATVSMDPAPHANDQACAAVMVRLPGNLSGQDRRWTDAQATAAWGAPSRILFTCGVTPPGPSTITCVSLGGVDWLVDRSEDPRFRITSFGRSPAVQLYLDGSDKAVDPNAILAQIGRIVATNTTRTAECASSESVGD